MVNYFPQSATQVYLKTAILGIPDFDFLNFRHIAVKIIRNFAISISDVSFFKRKVESSLSLVCKKFLLEILECFYLIIAITTSKINKQADIGSYCLQFEIL